MKYKIVTVLGARPQFVKAAVVSRIISKSTHLTEFIIHTGQHYDHNMSDLFFEELEIRPPDINLSIGSGSHGQQTGEMLKKIEEILFVQKPDIMLVYGDTNSTLAGALAASKLHIPIAHVEAGLRSYNRRMPEEVNRILTDHVSTFLFAPTSNSEENLINEGITQNVFVTGDVMLDAVKFYQPLADRKSLIMETLGLRGIPFFLATIHRAENTDDVGRLSEICKSFGRLAERHKVIFPVHPRTRKIIKNSGIRIDYPNLELIDPVGYLDMCSLVKSCQIMITDSGGVQKEAFMYNKYCVTVRPETEWVELVEEGFNYLVEPSAITELCEKLIMREFKNESFRPYGNGDAGNRIVHVLESALRT